MISRFRQPRIFALHLLLTFLALAQQPSISSSKPAQSPKTELGVLTNGAYRNAFFAFTYKLAYGWVDRTTDMREGDDPGKLLLLSVFEHPPEATGSTINSAVVIAAEKMSSFSGLKTASDYFGPITELATAKGFSALNEPHDFALGTTHLVRGDFSKQRGSLIMYQTSLVTLEKGCAVSFTFIGGGEDEIEELIEKLSFSGNQPQSR
ncbi:MAG: hypothetical protein DMG88_01530 [Acidobacteria bacterium]|nr:MAG: hypothetical protein DMG88_01530 [Acidobacteriota bacterium]